MRGFKREKRNTGGEAAVQLRDGGNQPFGMLGGYVPLSGGSVGLYRAIREAVPVVDAAVCKLVRLTGGLSVQCSSASAEKALSEFLRTVNTGRGQYGFNAFDVLTNGDGNGNAADAYAVGTSPIGGTAGALSYDALLDFWAQFDPYTMNTLLVSNDMMLAMLKLSEFQNPLTGLNFQGTGTLSTPMGAKLLRTSALSNGTLIGLDKNYALEHICGSEVMVEYAGAMEYLGERYDAVRDVVLEVYGRKMLMRFSLDVYAPRALGAEGCETAAEAVTQTMMSALPGGLRMKDIDWAEAKWDRVYGMFRLSAAAEYEAFFSAETAEEDVVFTDFILRGVVQKYE